MRYRLKVGFTNIDICRFPGESHSWVNVYDVEADTIFEAHGKARELADAEWKNPYCRVEITHPKLLGIVCEHCNGHGIFPVWKEEKDETQESSRQD